MEATPWERFFIDQKILHGKCVRKARCKHVATFVIDVSLVTVHPDKTNRVLLQECIEALPQLGIENRLFIGFFPAVFLPIFEPPLVDRLGQIFRVRGQRHVAGFFEKFKRRDRAHQLHSVVGRHRLSARDLFFLAAVYEDRAPSAATGIAPTRTVGINIYVLHLVSPFVCIALIYSTIFFSANQVPLSANENFLLLLGENISKALILFVSCCIIKMLFLMDEVVEMKDRDARLFEEQTSSELIFDGKVLHVFKDEIKLPNGKPSMREYIKHVGAVCVIPITDEGEVVCVRQYRYAVGKVLLEIPAGKLDSADENPRDAVLRELREETGAICGKLTPLGLYLGSPALIGEHIQMYLAEELTFGETDPDEDEFLEICRIPLSEMVDMVLRGEIPDGKTQAAVLRAAAMRRAL